VKLQHLWYDLLILALALSLRPESLHATFLNNVIPNCICITLYIMWYNRFDWQCTVAEKWPREISWNGWKSSSVFPHTDADARQQRSARITTVVIRSRYRKICRDCFTAFLWHKQLQFGIVHHQLRRRSIYTVHLLVLQVNKSVQSFWGWSVSNGLTLHLSF